MKKILKDNSGIALITVLGIMLVISILATGIFYVTTNELNFTKIEYDNSKAIYLAQAGIEIASKSYNTVSGEFDNIDKNPVSSTLYLHQNADGTNPQINSNEDGSIGYVTVTITEEVRDLAMAGSTKEYPVLVYRAEAEVQGVKGSAQGVTLPTAYGNTKPTTDAKHGTYLSWVGDDGIVKESLTNSDGTVYSASVPAEATGPITNMQNRINAFIGLDKKMGEIPIYFTYYTGVVTITEDDVNADAIRVDDRYDGSKGNCNRAFAMAAPAIVVDVPIDMTKSGNVASWHNSVNLLSFVANTIVFNKEITLYANEFGYQLGDVVLAPIIEGGTGVVYFNAPVYLINGNKKHTIFQAGSVYTFGAEVNGKEKGEPVQLFAYAYETGYANQSSSSSDNIFDILFSAIGGWIMKIKGDIETGGLEALSNPPIENPNANSLTEIIWE